MQIAGLLVQKHSMKESLEIYISTSDSPSYKLSLNT